MLDAADQLAIAVIVLAEVEDRRAVADDAHLVLDTAQRDVVGAADGTIRVHAELRDDEEREPFRSWRRTLRAGEHEVDDVLGDVVVTSRDVDLGPTDLEAAIRCAHRLGERGADIAPGLRLGETHGGEPLALEDPRGIQLFLGGRGAVLKEVGGAVGEPWVHVQRGVRAGGDLLDECRQDMGTALPTELLGRHDRLEPEFVKLVHSLLEARRRHDLAVDDLATLPVAHGVERTRDLVGELAALLEDHLHLVLTPGGERLLPQQITDAGLLEELEFELAEIDAIAVLLGGRHLGSVWRSSAWPE